MSYFMFGSLDSAKDKKKIQNVKAYGNERNVYFWFDDEITFYKDIQRMCTEQKSQGTILFAITSLNQHQNSSDLLFPYDKYSNEELFSDKSRKQFKKCCSDNLNIVFDCLKNLTETLNPLRMEIFVVEGYDDSFERRKCTLDEMKKDLLSQIEMTSFIDSCIYQTQ